MYFLHQVFLLPFSKSSNAPKSSLSAGYPCETTFTSNAGRAPRGGSKLATAIPNSRGYEADAASICLIPTLQLANKLEKLAFEISNYFKAMGYSLFQGNMNWGGISILQSAKRTCQIQRFQSPLRDPWDQFSNHHQKYFLYYQGWNLMECIFYKVRYYTSDKDPNATKKQFSFCHSCRCTF